MTQSAIRIPAEKDFIRVGEVEIMKDFVRLQDGSYAFADHYGATEIASQQGLRLPYVADMWSGYQYSRAIKKSIRQLASKTESTEWSGEILLSDFCLARPRKVAKVDGRKRYSDAEIIFLSSRIHEDYGYVSELNEFALPTKLTPRPYIMKKDFPYWWLSGLGVLTISYAGKLEDDPETFAAGAAINAHQQQAFRFVRDPRPNAPNPIKI